MMRNTVGLRRGGPGRRPGVPNKATRELRTFLQDVVYEAMDHSEFRSQLVNRIRSLSIDPRLLQLVLAYAFGKPAARVDLDVHQVTLEQIIVGRVPHDDDRPTRADGRPTARAVITAENGR